MHRRSLEGPLWLMYRGYKYKWCFIDIPHITAFHWCRILSKKLGGPLIISQAARWTIQCTGDHQRGHFDWQTEATVRILHITAFHWFRILNMKLGGPLIISQTARCSFNAPEVIGWAALTDTIYWGFTYIWCTVGVLHITNSQMFHSMHWRSLQVPLWLMHRGYTYTVYGVLLEWCISQLFIDVRYSKRSLVVFSSYHKQPMVHSMYQRSLEGLLWLMYWCYKYSIYTFGMLHITAFQWYNILNRDRKSVV